MNNNEYYMQLALNQAKKAYKKKEVPVGAIIVYNGKIIGKGYNLRENKKNIFKHAELLAIKKASKKIKDWRLNNAVMYVTLFPCSMCASAIVQSRIKKIYIGAPTKDLKTKEIVKKIFEGNNVSPKIEVYENVLENECKSLLTNFFNERRKNVKIT